MKRGLRTLALAAALFAAPGCVELDTVVRVSPDGSGTVSERMVLSAATVEQLETMTAELSAMGDGGELEGFDIVDRKRLERRAASMGEGVALAKLEALETDRGRGYRAVFSFSDIGRLSIDQNPGSAVPTGRFAEPAGREAISFAFEPGEKAVLTVSMPEEPRQDEAFGGGEGAVGESFPPDEDAAQAEEQMREMFRDLRVSVAVEIDGKIVATNASHREGSRITLMELDFGKLLDTPGRFEAMQSARPQSLEEAKKVMAEIPGVRVEMAREIRVTFE